VYVEGAPAPLPRALASLLAARLAEAKLDALAIDAPNPSLAERSAREAGVVSLLRLTVSLEGTHLLVRGDALGTRRNFWSGELPVRTGPAAAIALAFDADAEVQTLAGTNAASAAPVPLELRVSSIVKGPGVPAALAVGDLDGDKKGELVVLAQDRLLVFSSEGRLLAKAELVAPLSSRPAREPFGLVSLSTGRVLVWSGRRERPEAFSYAHGALRSMGVVDAFLLDALALRLEPSFNRAAADVLWASKAVTLPLPPQSVSAVGPLTLFTFADGSGALARGLAPTSRVLGVGSGSVLADLDGDGTPEVLVTSARSFGDADELRVFSLAAFEALQGRGGLVAEGSALLQLGLKGRAVVAAAGDLDGDGADEVVLGLWGADGTGELVLLKRVTP
jgi:hypothetical protein